MTNLVVDRWPLLTTSRISSLDRKRFTRGSNLPLGAELGATLTTTGCQDGSAGTGAHASTETVGLRTAAVVWLESALGHFETPESYGLGP